jgi:N-acetylneuraminic acid mutarotase
MKNKSTSPSGIFNLRALLVLLACTTAACLPVLGTSLAFFRPEALAQPPQRTLTFEERVSYQRAIEEVYWRHRIWPKERPDPKPPLDAVVSQTQLEKKVTDYLRNSQALEDYWQRPITAEQLQAEMERMAKNTKQPEVLRELFEALGNDPFVIAECLARPALAERLLTNWYAYDQRIHGELKQRAEAELQTHSAVEQMKQLSGKYSEVEFIKSDRAEHERHRNPQRGMELNTGEWDETSRKLASIFDTIPHARARKGGAIAGAVSPAKNARIKTGILSSLQEDEERFYATAVIEKTDDRLRVATVSWHKEQLESWLARTEAHARTAMTAPSGDHTLPSVSDGGCVDDTWTATSGPPESRYGHAAVWTGSEMIVWGGFQFEGFSNTGGRYNPSTDSWAATTTANAPSPRASTAVWTGTEMIIWGGRDGVNYLNTGGRYNPSSDSWTATSMSGAPTARSGTLVWTGSEIIIWGGFSDIGYTNTGGRYNPDTDSWTATSTTNAPTGRSIHTAVWSGSEMIVWGGTSDSVTYLNSGGRYDPGTNSWTATNTANAPSGREFHEAVWSGEAMIVWGGYNGNYLDTGGRYNPTTDSWTATSTTNTPSAQPSYTAVWTGSEMIVWGSSDQLGGRYNPPTDSWTATSTTNAPSVRSSHTAVWTGSEMIVWGGWDNQLNALNTGGRYNPVTDSWTPTGTESAPTGRYRHSGVWTGSEMIIWGGRTRDLGFLNTGAKYIPSSDSWTAMTMTNAPLGRAYHATVWTGSEMIVWGGFNTALGDLNTGGRYNPGTDIWTATSTANAPAGRELHTAVWTGSHMIVWGGYSYDGADHYWNTGGRYNPITDSWTATTITSAPTGRDVHTAVWTDGQMVIWGGYFYDGVDHYLNTGGRYSPATNSWTATNPINAPSGRDSHRAAWTGSEMIIWGGFNDIAGYTNTGGRYNPDTNTWTVTSPINAPSERAGHSLVWTGDKMIVWGGLFFDCDYHFLNDGGRYDPGSNSWTDVSIVNAPTPRDLHAAVWTGNEMVIWGGLLFANVGSGTGGRYCVQASPTPTPTPCVGRCEPTPRPRPTPRVRPTPH